MTKKPAPTLTETLRSAAVELREKFLAVANDPTFSEADREDAVQQAARLTIVLADGDALFMSRGGQC